MNLTGLLAVSGMPGIYKAVKNRTDGLIVDDVVEGKKKFIPARGNTFTPLESISIYTESEENVELTKVFKAMYDMELAGDAPVDIKVATNDQLREYFTDVLPAHDKNKVYPNDIKKVIKWYTYIKSNKLVDFEGE